MSSKSVREGSTKLLVALLVRWAVLLRQVRAPLPSQSPTKAVVPVRDPLLTAMVTAVEVSRDLSVARVYFSSLDLDAEPEELVGAIESASGFIRSQLARELTVRNVPELRFRFDTSLRDGEAMEQLIDSAIERDRDGRQGDSDERDS